MSQDARDVTLEIVSSDLDSHLNNLIKNISDDDCSCTSSQEYVGNEPAENRVLCELSQSGVYDPRPSSQVNEHTNLQHLHNCNEISKIKSFNNDGERNDENLLVDDLILDVKSEKTKAHSKMSADLPVQFHNSDKGSVLNVTSHVLEKLECKNKFEGDPNQSSNADQDQILYQSNSWPNDSNKLRKRKYQSDYKLAEMNKRCATELVVFEADKCSALNQELLFQEKGSKPVSPHHGNIFGTEVVSESVLEVEINSSTLASMSQMTHDVNQHQKSVVEDLQRSKCASDEPGTAKKTANILILQTSEETPVSLEMPNLDLKHSTGSQPDIFTLYTNDKSADKNSVVTFKLNAPLLSQHASSPVSIILPQELSSQSSVNAVISTSPLRSDGILMTSEHSLLLPPEVSSPKEEPRPLELFSSYTSVESSLPCGMSIRTQHKEFASPTNEQSLLTMSNVMSNYIANENLKKNEDKTSFVGNLPLTPSCSESFDRSRFLTQEILAVMPCLDEKVEVTHELPLTIVEESPTKLCKRSKSPIYEISVRDSSPGQANSKFCNNDQEVCHHRYKRHAIDISKSEYEYQEMPKSPQMLMSMDGITYSLPNADDFPYAVPSGDHIVPHYEKTETEKLKYDTENFNNKQTISDSDHTYCEEINELLLSKPEILHSSFINSDPIQNCGTSISWPKVMSDCTSHYQNSTRVSLTISTELDDSKETDNTICIEDIGSSPKHCSGKLALSHLNNETSTWCCEKTLITEEQRVPEAETCGNMCLNEISLYSGSPDHKQNDLMCKQHVKQAFQWTSVYETVMSKSFTDQRTGDSVFEGLSSLSTIAQSHRSIRVGLSRKQKVKHLHSKP